jgi:hypothetical protein
VASPASVNLVPRYFHKGVKLSGRETGHSPTSSAETKNGGANPSPFTGPHGVVLN